MTHARSKQSLYSGQIESSGRVGRTQFYLANKCTDTKSLAIQRVSIALGHLTLKLEWLAASHMMVYQLRASMALTCKSSAET